MTAHFTSSDPLGEDDLVYTLLERYWLGETSPEETALVSGWLITHPDAQRQYERLRSELQTGDWVDLSSTDVTRIIAKTLDATGLTAIPDKPFTKLPTASASVDRNVHQKSIPSPHGFMRNAIVSRWTGYISAVVIIILVSLVIGWQSGVDRVKTNLATQASVYTTAQGKQATIKLPDGSTVLLNVASRLEVPSNFVTGNRIVKLKGEALFTVTHQTGAPFTVIAGASTTRVLGTSFVVRHYPTDTSTLVAVRDGKVAVQSVILTARQQIEVNTMGVTAIHNVTPSQFGFATGTMTLDHVQLRNAILDLDRWYDADIRVTDPRLDMRQFTLECGNESLSDLANILELTLGIRVERSGRVLTLFPR
jgi:ferric-dicitrate binding protein FerR (iron transport regulator)